MSLSLQFLSTSRFTLIERWINIIIFMEILQHKKSGENVFSPLISSVSVSSVLSETRFCLFLLYSQSVSLYVCNLTLSTLLPKQIFTTVMTVGTSFMPSLWPRLPGIISSTFNWGDVRQAPWISADNPQSAITAEPAQHLTWFEARIWQA